MKQTETAREIFVDIAIVGGGFSGAVLAAELLAAGELSPSVILIERQGNPGRGVAYGTRFGGHLLNVRAQNMSGRADEPLHFLRWAQRNYSANVQPGDYVPRRVYGQYIESLLREAGESNPGRFKWKQDEAIAITPIDGKAEISLRSGGRVIAAKIVLALGNFPPADPKFPGRAVASSRYVSNPWAAKALDCMEQDEEVLLVGSGLTSVDVAIALRERGFSAKVHMLSRHGLLPQQHKVTEPWSAFWNKSPRTARGLLRLIRAQVRNAAQQKIDWCAVIDSVRPFAQKIWISLPLKERRQFLRHLRAYWDVHRHRVAPQIGKMLTTEIAGGRIETHAGRITEYREQADCVEVSYRERRTGELKKLFVNRVINCTGPDADIRRINDPLLKNLLSRQLVRPDALSLGLETSEEGALIGPTGTPSDLLYTIGPLRRGSLWETTAVPEIRVQASRLALHLISNIERQTAGFADSKRHVPTVIAQAAGKNSVAMYFEQCYLGCLAHASYILISQGEAVVVDPQRDVEMYCEIASSHGAKIRHIFETHLHADFVSGHKELAARTGANIYIGVRANAVFHHIGVQNGFELRAGSMHLKVLETPGHTPESICLLITDEEKSQKPWALLTGDTLFLGDVGRPDLSTTHTPKELAGLLYDSLHEKILKLSDDVLVYPAHGAGSLCGRNMRAERSSTIGIERLTNYALQIDSREEFVAELTANMPSRPKYFLQDAELNRQGATALSELPALHPVSAQELAAELENGAYALDVRPDHVFAAAHVPGSINIPLSGQFASWAGIVLGLSSGPVLIADTEEQLSEARLRLARVGIEQVRGYLPDGIEGWKRAGFALQSSRQISVQTLNQWRQNSSIPIIDVRREAEFQAGHIADAYWIPLDELANAPLPLERDALVAIHCKSGYRSAIACSVLQRAGFGNVVNVTGGFDAWQEAQLPVISDRAVEV